jgi:outer membrane protein assembly factor BamB
MNQCSKIAVALSLFFVFSIPISGSVSNELENKTPSVVPNQFIIALSNDSIYASAHSFLWRAKHYKINARGVMSVSNGSKNQQYRIRFSTQKTDVIEKLMVTEYQTNLVLVGEVNNGGEGAGFILILNRSNLKQQWLTWIPAFNVGIPLVRGNYIYLSGIGFIGKLNLSTGRYIWKHDDLYRKNEAFNNFATPVIEGTTIVFFGEGTSNKATNEIVVDHLSGKIIKFRVPK